MKFWNNNLKTLSPYVPGEQPKNIDSIIKLNTNENPYPPSPNIEKHLKEVNTGELALYPDPHWTKLRGALAKRYNINIDKVFCGNGSDEILSLIFRSFLNPNDEIIIPYPNYSLYETLAESNGIKYNYIQSDKDFNISFDSLSGKPSKAIFFSNPNAPTGKYYNLESILNFCKDYSGLFILDEAYIDFAGENAGTNLSGIKLLDELDNLIVIRTFSKSFSLAGIRSGYCFASPSLTAGFMRMKDSYNLNYLTQQISYEALEDYSYMERNIEKIINDRDFLTSELKKLGFLIFDSKTNFIFAKHPDYSSKKLYNSLKEKGILVRYFNQARVSDYLRITIGKRHDLEKLIEYCKILLNRV